jgi:ABC-type nitrate/sulfonate/bicarbonate transport system permease component
VTPTSALVRLASGGARRAHVARALGSEQMLLGTLGFLIILAAWQMGTVVGVAGSLTFPSPGQTLAAFVRQLTSGQLVADLATSSVLFLTALGAAALIGIPLGALSGWSTTVRGVIAPHIALFYSMPSIGLLPLAIVWLGFGFRSQFAICLLFAFFPAYYAGYEAVTTVDRALVGVARTFGASRRFVFRAIVLPGSVPVLLHGLRVAVVMTIRGVVLVELIASTAGVGYRLQEFGDHFQTANIFALIIVIAFVGVVADAILRLVERRLDRWRPERDVQSAPRPTRAPLGRVGD